jgi:fructoselysine-6-P-deglycase FrlB-like protein
MLEEIAEQPAALAKTIAEEREKVARLAWAVRARDIDLIVLVARGSSDKRGVVRALSSGNHYGHPGFALCSIGPHRCIARS